MIKFLISIFNNFKSYFIKFFSIDNFSHLLTKTKENNLSKELTEYKILKNFKRISKNQIVESEKYINKILNLNSRNEKSVYVNIINSKDFNFENRLIKIALDEEILNIVQNYMGERSILWDIRVLKSENKNNLKIQNDQLWHRDKYDTKSLRLWLSLSDCNNIDLGPFQYMPFHISKKIIKSFFGRVNDDYIKKKKLFKYVDYLYTNKGEVSLIDVSNLLHFVSRIKSGKNRLVFNAIYTTAKPLKYPTFDLNLRNKIMKNINLSNIQKSFLSY